MESTAEVGLDAIRRDGVREQPDVSALASLEDRSLSVLVWHYHDDDLPGPDAAVALELTGLPVENGRVLLQHYRIDDDHSNAFEAWKAMGSPQQPTADQLSALEAVGAAEAADFTPSGTAPKPASWS